MNGGGEQRHLYLAGNSWRESQRPNPPSLTEMDEGAPRAHSVSGSSSTCTLISWKTDAFH